MKEKIKEAKKLVQKGRLKEGVELLLEVAPKKWESEISIISANINKADRQTSLGLVSYRDASITFSQTVKASLDLIEEIESHLGGKIWNSTEKATYFLNQAVAFNKEKRFSEAISLLDRAYEIDAGNALILIERALAKMSLLLFSEAIVDLSEALGKEPINPYAYFLRAQAYEALGYRERAQQDMAAFNEFGIPFSQLKTR